MRILVYGSYRDANGFLFGELQGDGPRQGVIIDEFELTESGKDKPLPAGAQGRAAHLCGHSLRERAHRR